MFRLERLVGFIWIWLNLKYLWIILLFFSVFPRLIRLSYLLMNFILINELNTILLLLYTNLIKICFKLLVLTISLNFWLNLFSLCLKLLSLSHMVFHLDLIIRSIGIINQHLCLLVLILILSVFTKWLLNVWLLLLIIAYVWIALMLLKMLLLNLGS